MNLFVSNSIKGEFLEWLKSHVEEMTSLPVFQKSHIWQETLENPSTKTAQFTCTYYSNSITDLQRYFEEYADKMRSDGFKRFSDKMTAKRRVFSLVASYTNC